MREYVERSGIRLKKGMAVIVIIAGLMTVVGIILACAPPQKQIVRPLPTSQWGGN
jgi:branched-subunit amino acid permease